MPDSDDSIDPVAPKVLGPLLESVVKENKAKVIGWINQEPGCWGALAGIAVSACRSKVGRTLSDGERRLVWNRLWAYLEQVKRHVDQQ